MRSRREGAAGACQMCDASCLTCHHQCRAKLPASGCGLDSTPSMTLERDTVRHVAITGYWLGCARGVALFSFSGSRSR